MPFRSFSEGGYIREYYMKYAVIQTGGKQYRVAAGENLDIEKLGVKEGEKIFFDKVLLVVDDDKVKIGTPYLKNVVVEARVAVQKKGKKIRIARFRAKSRYRRVIGHRQKLTEVEIIGIKSKKKTKV